MFHELFNYRIVYQFDTKSTGDWFLIADSETEAIEEFRKRNGNKPIIRIETI